METRAIRKARKELNPKNSLYENYELFKKMLDQWNLKPDEYEKMIKLWCERYGM